MKTSEDKIIRVEGHTVGLSQFHGAATNETVQGRSQNRRIEIALLPMEKGSE